MISLPVYNSKVKLPCYVFDIDGTLADNEHRLHLIKSYPKNWDEFNRLMTEDGVYDNVVNIFHALSYNYTCILLTGRSEDHRDETEEWLEKNGIEPDALLMRMSGDMRPDNEVKAEYAEVIEENFDILGVFEDRKKVIDMWISRGTYVFDCSQGKPEF